MADQLLYKPDGSNCVTELPNGTLGQELVMGATGPTWQSATAFAETTFAATGGAGIATTASGANGHAPTITFDPSTLPGGVQGTLGGAGTANTYVGADGRTHLLPALPTTTETTFAASSNNAHLTVIANGVSGHAPILNYSLAGDIADQAAGAQGVLGGAGTANTYVGADGQLHLLPPAVTFTAAADCVLPPRIIGSDRQTYTGVFTPSDESAARPATPIANLTASAATVDLATGLIFKDSNDLQFTVAADPSGCGAQVQASQRQIVARMITSGNNILANQFVLTPLTNWALTSINTDPNLLVANLALGTFTVQLAGVYRIYGYIGIAPPFTLQANDGIELYLQRNNAFIANNYQIGYFKNLSTTAYNAVTATLVVTGNDVISLSAGDSLRLLVANSDPAVKTISNRIFIVERV